MAPLQRCQQPTSKQHRRFPPRFLNMKFLPMPRLLHFSSLLAASCSAPFQLTLGSSSYLLPAPSFYHRGGTCLSLQQRKAMAGGSTDTRDEGNPPGLSALLGHGRAISREGCAGPQVVRPQPRAASPVPHANLTLQFGEPSPTRKERTPSAFRARQAAFPRVPISGTINPSTL